MAVVSELYPVQELQSHIYSLVYDQWHMSARGLRYLHEKTGADEYCLASFIVIGTSIYLVLGYYAQIVANSILTMVPILITFVYPEEKPPFENLLYYWCAYFIATLFYDPKPDEKGGYYFLKMLLLVLLIVFPPNDIQMIVLQSTDQKAVPDKKFQCSAVNKSRVIPSKDSITYPVREFPKEVKVIKMKKTLITSAKESKLVTSKRPEVASVANISTNSLIEPHAVTLELKDITIKGPQTLVVKETDTASPGRVQSPIVQKPELQTVQEFCNKSMELRRVSVAHKPEIITEVFPQSALTAASQTVPVRESETELIKRLQTVRVPSSNSTEPLEVFQVDTMQQASDVCPENAQNSPVPRLQNAPDVKPQISCSKKPQITTEAIHVHELAQLTTSAKETDVEKTQSDSEDEDSRNVEAEMPQTNVTWVAVGKTIITTKYVKYE